MFLMLATAEDSVEQLGHTKGHLMALEYLLIGPMKRCPDVPELSCYGYTL